MKGAKTNIPAGTRALYLSRHYISRQSDSLGCLHRLLEDPFRSRRIVTLDIPCDVDKKTYGPLLFEVLVKNSDLLSGVRNLAFDVVRLSEVLLGAINQAFPALVCLVLRSSLGLDAVMLSGRAVQKRTVTFEKLEILEVEYALLYDGINFPLLRHAALGCCTQKVMGALSRLPLLESLILRKILYEGNQETVHLGSLPKLKLLGIPVYGENTVVPFPVVPLPPDYAHHLCVYVPSSVTGLALVEWVKKVPSHFPKLQQISLDLTELALAQRVSVESAFRCINLELEPSGLVINHLPPGSSYVVIERIVERPKVSSISEASLTPQSEKWLGRWNNFRRTASRRLHL